MSKPTLFRYLILLVCVLATAACSSIPKKALKPKVELVSVVPLNISVSEQKLRFHLNVTNPNSFELPVESVDFIARFNDTDIASGKSLQSAVIPPNGAATLTLDVTAGIDRLASTLQTLLQGEQLNLNYELTGSVKIEDWATPIPFNVIGAMDPDKAFKS
ncbi:MAG: LEA type 2 family protein [Pseudomonadota bacterium]